MGEERRFLNEDEIEHMMLQLPQIKDRRNKAEVYEKIKLKMAEQSQPKRRVKQYWLPLVTAAAAILLLIVISSTLFQEGEQQNGENAVAFDASSFANVEDAKESKMDTFSRGFPEVSSMEENFAEESKEMKQITVPYADDDTEFIIPLSFTLNATDDEVEQMNNYINTDSKQFLASSNSAIFQGIEIKEEQGELVFTIPDGKFSGGTASARLFFEGTQVILDSLGYEKVKLQTEEGTPVSLDQFGEVSELKHEEKTGGYFLFRTAEDKQMLVPGELSYFNRVNMEGKPSLAKVLSEMASPEDIELIHSPFPTGVTLGEVHDDGRLVNISLQGGERLANDEETKLLVEAILLTAKQFGYDDVMLQGVGVEQVGQYNLTEPIETMIVPNIQKPSS